jgi:hypothetical protein
MPDDPTDAPAESSVILQLIARGSGISRDDLYTAIRAFPNDRIDAAVSALESIGLARSTPQRVYASDALQRLDNLGLISV